MPNTGKLAGFALQSTTLMRKHAKKEPSVGQIDNFQKLFDRIKKSIDKNEKDVWQIRTMFSLKCVMIEEISAINLKLQLR